ncbi:MAG: 3-oxoacid CoA-transferase subunit A, partial [Treponemataceae bacterium]
TAKQMYEGFLEVVLVPQGSLAEKIRAGGAGIGGVLTPTGVGTPVAEGKQLIEMNGKQYLLEPALHADVALIRARKADKNGNLVYAGTARNFNPVMATAADYVIALVDEIVENGEIDPDAVHTPGVFIDALVRAEG